MGEETRYWSQVFPMLHQTALLSEMLTICFIVQQSGAGDVIVDCFRHPRLLSLGVKAALYQFRVMRQYRISLYTMSKYTWHIM